MQHGSASLLLPDHVLSAPQLRWRRYRNPTIRARAGSPRSPCHRATRRRCLRQSEQRCRSLRTARARGTDPNRSEKPPRHRIEPTHSTDGTTDRSRPSHSAHSRRRTLRRRQLPQRVARRRTWSSELRRQCDPTIHGARALARMSDARVVATSSRAMRCERLRALLAHLSASATALSLRRLLRAAAGASRHIHRDERVQSRQALRVRLSSPHGSGAVLSS